MALARTATPPRAPAGGTPRGLGTAEITVKGARASAEQRRTIDAALREAHRLGATPLVMAGVVMAITQESNGGDPRYTRRGDAAGPDSRGPYQQRAPWGSFAERMDPTTSTRIFLTVDRGHGVRGWRAVHGSLAAAPGGLAAAINAVQISANASLYARHQPEAERTVAAFLGPGGEAGTGGPATARFDFTRGERGGERETSWDATGRLAEEVGWWRWAAGNVLHFVSPEELREGAPGVVIRGDEPFLRARPAWDWAEARPLTELRLPILADRWAVMPGAVVLVRMGGPYDGRWLVRSVGGSRLDSPEAEVVLVRPSARLPEPAAETETPAGEGPGVGAEGGPASGANPVLEGAKRFHAMGLSYVWGGGHASAGTPTAGGMDCSGAVAAALAAAGHGFTPGQTVPASGWWVSNWGRPGPGRTYTVLANAGHIFIAFPGSPEGWARFDTSPHGDGGRGPRLRRTARSDHGRFAARHWPGF